MKQRCGICGYILTETDPLDRCPNCNTDAGKLETLLSLVEGETDIVKRYAAPDDVAVAKRRSTKRDSKRR